MQVTLGARYLRTATATKMLGQQTSEECEGRAIAG
jgi:hypothetical protein